MAKGFSQVEGLDFGETFTPVASTLIFVITSCVITKLKETSLQGVRSEEQLADIFTKPLDESTFVRLRNELNVLDAANVM